MYIHINRQGDEDPCLLMGKWVSLLKKKKERKSWLQNSIYETAYFGRKKQLLKCVYLSVCG